MGIFGLGAALPVVVLAYVSRSAMMRIRGLLRLGSLLPGRQKIWLGAGGN
jgi:hypothetical protein